MFFAVGVNSFELFQQSRYHRRATLDSEDNTQLLRRANVPGSGGHAITSGIHANKKAGLTSGLSKIRGIQITVSTDRTGCNWAGEDS